MTWTEAPNTIPLPMVQATLSPIFRTPAVAINRRAGPDPAGAPKSRLRAHPGRRTTERKRLAVSRAAVGRPGVRWAKAVLSATVLWNWDAEQKLDQAA